MPPASPRDRIIEATMELAAEREWNDFTLADVARRAIGIDSIAGCSFTGGSLTTVASATKSAAA